ncbi:MAG: aldehyde dehydrogenase family protein [Rhodospirillaceae bacterium]|nr:aldehyde dehydrogenase family protein [Rhodospirillaceae bacterium]
MTEKFGDRLMLINGEMVASGGGEWITTVNPANEEPIGRVPAATVDDVNAAVAAAKTAQPAWAAKSIFERGALLRALAATFRERAQEILTMEATDTGNTIAKLDADVQIAGAYLEYFAGLATEMKGDTVPASPGNIHFSLREPFGVVARIVPFNHPFMFAGAHLASPLIAGNTVVVKTPETSPLTGSLLAECCRDVLPPGVVNIVSGLGLPAGDTLVRHPDVDRIGFTGSVPTGLAIQRAAAEVSVKHVSLELGGKNPLIVFPDADLDKVEDASIAGMNFSWAGQSCGSTSRILAHESVYDELVERVAARTDAVLLGDPLDPASEMGPVNSEGHYNAVMKFVESGKRDGAKLVAGGARPDGEHFKRGYWLRPTVFADATMDMEVAHEEIFGPVVSMLKWSTREEAVEMANATAYGLTAAIYTNDLQDAMKTAQEVESGYVWINGVAQHYVGLPFGGVKNSGLGGEESLEELLSYTRTKTVNVLLN